LTTAASLLLTAGIGMTVALGQWVLAFGVAVLVLIILSSVKVLDRWLNQARSARADSRVE
jgi:uncharacterized membrane protein YhiD involved in acid resistance